MQVGKTETIHKETYIYITIMCTANLTCGMYPMFPLVFALTNMSPESISVLPTTTFNNVVFPHPLGPKSP